MSILLDDEKIALVARILEIAEAIPEVYATIDRVIKDAHPQLVPADLPPDEREAQRALADALIETKFGKKV